MKFKALALAQTFKFDTVSDWRIPTTEVCRKISARRFEIVSTGSIEQINTTAAPVVIAKAGRPRIDRSAIAKIELNAQAKTATAAKA